MTDLPTGRRLDWLNWVDRPQTAAEEAAVLRCLNESRPYGTDRWVDKFKQTLGWQEPLKSGHPPARRGR